MKICPHCGAELPEEVQFCLYCMTNLTEKWDITPKLPPKKRYWLAGALSLVLIIGVLLWFNRPHREPLEQQSTAPSEPTETTQPAAPSEPEETTQPPTTSGPEETTQPTASSNIICSYDDLVLRAVYLTGKDSLSTLWNPDGFVNTHTGTDSDGDTWEIYSTDVYLEGVQLRLHFCQDGEEILLSVTGLTKETYADGVQLAQCITESVYNYTFTNFQQMLTDHDTSPMSDVEPGGCLIELAKLPDPAGDRYATATVQRLGIQLDQQTFPGQYLFFDLRSGIVREQTGYDIFLLFTQE